MTLTSKILYRAFKNVFLRCRETAVCGCHCPRDMAVRKREVLARPWVCVCVPLALSLHYFQCTRIKLNLFSSNTDFASTSQPVHTKQQCSYMGAWASQATVPFIQHICRYVQISSNIYKRKNRSTKAGHENPKKPAGGKNTGNVYPRPRQWCNPWGFRVC